MLTAEPAATTELPAGKRVWRPPVLGLVVIALAAFFVPYPVVHQGGWPANDESLSAFERIEGFRRAFHAGDWYPLWTPFAHTGWGSPYPLFYHRLYSTLGALLSMAINPVKPEAVLPAVQTLTVALLFLGGAGMRRLLKLAGVDEATAVCGALLFIVAPYTRAEWFARGAMAEFTAMMMLPWLYAELSLFVRGQRRWLVCAAGTVLLFFAHSMICLYFLLSSAALVSVTTIGPNRRRTWGGVTREWPWILLAVIGALLCVVPHALVARRMMPFFNTEIMTQGMWRIRENFRPFGWYFVDPFTPTMAFDPNRPWFSIEVNRFVLGSLAALALLPGAWNRLRAQMKVPMFGFMLAWFLICLLLQLPELRFVFRYVPQGKYLQFPWRLLCFMTVASVFMFAAGVRSLLAGTTREQTVGRVGPWVVLAMTGWMFCGSWFRAEPGAIDWFSPQLIADDLKHLDGPLSAGEYQLRGMEKFALWGQQRDFVQGDCPIAPAIVRDFASEDFKLVAEEPAACHVDIKQFQTPMLRLSLQNATLVSPSPSLDFQIELGAGKSAVRLRPRTLWELVSWTLANPK